MVLLERDELLRELGSLLAQSRRGAGRLALVGGEAGIGKTSLLRAFADRVRGHDVLWGSCDPVSPGRPFAPLTDMAAAAGGRLEDALADGDRNRVFDAFLHLVRRGRTIVVIDDLHWADAATLDLLRVAGRRLPGISALVVGSFRSDEVGADHPLRLALGDVPAEAVVELRVPPLSVDAVWQLARGSRVAADALHRGTGGNAFFVTEVLAANDAGEVPPTVRDAVLARVARLPLDARRLLHAAAVLVPWCERRLLLEAAEESAAALDRVVQGGLLIEDGANVAFRHEIAARAVLDSVSASTLSTIHRRALASLRERADAVAPVRLSRHAIGCDDAKAILELAPVAGRHAADFGAHREAALHFRAAVAYRSGLEPRARANLLEAYAAEARLTDDTVACREATEEALRCWREVGDPEREAACLRGLSLALYLDGHGDRAIASAQQAVAKLEAVEFQGPELARALATLALRQMVEGRDDATAVANGRRALELAERWGDEQVAVHALTTIGVTEIFLDRETGWQALEESADRALRSGLHEDAARALINLVETATVLKRFAVAERHLDRALAFLDAQDLVLYRRLLLGRRAELAFEQGRWDFAAAEAEALLALPRTTALTRIRALTLLGRLRSRRGEPSASALLDEALERVLPDEAQEVCPLRAARAEAAWLAGNLESAREEVTAGLPLALMASDSPMPWWWAELAFWSWRLGVTRRLPRAIPRPYRLQARSSHRQAAATWAALGCPYQQASALAESDREDDLRDALHILHRLGAAPLAAAVVARLRGLGARRIPRGPHGATRRNAAGLTRREVEVLSLVADGLHNRQIADRLVVADRTVDHHLAAVFRKLQVHDRRAAVREAERLGLEYW